MKIWASVLHWGSNEDTWRAIASLRAQSRPPDGIVVIDNASEEPFDKQRTDASGLLIEREPANLGFAAGQNRGMTLALARGAEAVLLLNNDATLQPASLARLEACLAARPDVGLLGPVIRSADPPHLIESAGIRLNQATGRMRLCHHGRTSLPPGAAVEQVDALSGAALLATAAHIRRVGLLRPEYFCYFEEVDWCLRARAAGLGVVLIRDAEARHRVGSAWEGKPTAKRGTDLKTYYATRNHLRCLSRNAPLSGLRGEARRRYVGLLNLLFALRGPERTRRLAAVRQGIRDAGLRVFGPHPDHPGALPIAPPLADARQPRVAAVVLAWNRLDDTIECIESLKACDTPDLDIILVDNASRDPVAATVRERFEGVHVLENETNLGYAGGNNVGIRYALALGADYVFVLNNDAIVTPDAIDQLVSLAESDAEVGAAGARVMQYEVRDRMYGAVGTLVYLPALIRLEGLHRSDLDLFRATRDGDFIPGCSILFRAEALRRVGLFDERFFAYHEDVDWCARAWSAGWRSCYLPSSVIHHRGAIYQGASPVADYRYYFYGRNAVLFARKHARRGQMAFLLFTSAIYLAGSVVKRMARREPAAQVLRTAGLVLRGMRDGWRGERLRLSEIGLR